MTRLIVFKKDTPFEYSADEATAPANLLPTPWLTDTIDGGCATFNNGFIHCGGRTSTDALDTCQFYELGSDTVDPFPSMPVARQKFASTMVGDQWWVSGGKTSIGKKCL